MKIIAKILLSIVLGFLAICLFFTVANRISESAIHEYIDTFGEVEYENQLQPQYDENGVAYFVTDEDFKVMQLTDIHMSGSMITAKKDKMAINAIAAMINEEKPDLVVVTGDISFVLPWTANLNNLTAHELFSHLMENLGVYWTVAFGNHEDEPYSLYTRSDVADIYESEELEYCLFDRGPDDVYGECNHAINVRNSKGLVTRSIIMIDTNSYKEEDTFGFEWIYDNIHEDQIQWYRDTIEGLNEYNRSIDENAECVKSLMFFHIPLMEVRDAYHEYLENGENDELKYIRGEVGEKDPYVYCSDEAEEMFETIVELGSTEALFYGHDHVNNIVLEYKGITLCYGYSIDYFAYWQIAKQGSQRGCTIINCRPDTTFEIIHENYYQDKYVPLYEKEVVKE